MPSDRIYERLQQLHFLFANLDGIALVRTSGLVIASTMPAPIEMDRLAAMIAPLFALGRLAFERARPDDPPGDYHLLTIRLARGDWYLCVVQAGPSALLMALFRWRFSEPWFKLRMMADELAPLLDETP